MVLNKDKSLRRYLSQHPDHLKDEVQIISISNGLKDHDGWVTETSYKVSITIANQQFMGVAFEHMLEEKI